MGHSIMPSRTMTRQIKVSVTASGVQATLSTKLPLHSIVQQRTIYPALGYHNEIY